MFLLLILLATQSFADNVTDDSNYIENHVNYTALNIESCASTICIRKCCANGCHYQIDSNTTSSCKLDGSKNFTEDNCYINDEDGFNVGILGCVDKEEIIEYNRAKVYSTHFASIRNKSSYFFIGINRTIPFSDYCVDEINGIKNYYGCTDIDYSGSISWPIHLTVIISSIPFLLATCLVYVILPKKNVHRKALIWHTLFRSISDILVAMDLDDRHFILDEGSSTVCVISVYIQVFCITTSYFWMNVMCIDVWMAFSKLRGFQGPLSKGNVLFKIFSVYAWGIPTLTVLVMGILDGFNINIHSPFYLEGFACSRQVVPYCLFFLVPLAFLLIFNGILFVLTTISIRRAKRENAAMLGRGESAKHTASKENKFNLYWKLHFLMGNPVINFRLIELLALSSNSWVYHITLLNFYVYWENFVHAMYGIIIFVIFVCSNSIWKELKERFSTNSTGVGVKFGQEVQRSVDPKSITGLTN